MPPAAPTARGALFALSSNSLRRPPREGGPKMLPTGVGQPPLSAPSAFQRAAAEPRRGAYRPEARLRWLRAAIAVAFLSGVALSPRLWLTNDREYPIVPVADFVPRLGAPCEAIVVGGLVASLAAVATLPRSRVPIALALGLALSLALFDQNRWQPWVYQYLLMLAALAMVPPNARERSRRAQAALAVCAFIVVAVYFWSGLSKVGAAFRLDVFPWLLEPLVGPTAGLLEPVGYVVPVIEMSIGLGLAWRRTRPYAVVGAFLMHTFILLSIGPLGHQWNTVVWPWNIAMVAFVFFLFWRLDVSVTDFLPSVRS